MKFPSLSQPRVFAGAALLAWLSPRTVRADESIRYKYQDYNEAGGRVDVQVHSAGIEKDFGTATHFKLEGVVDSIAGATPNGQPAPAGSTEVPLSQLTEKRKAWNAVLSHQFAAVNLAVGVANSRESDYVSDGWSLNALFDFNQKNTTLLAGVAGTDDDIKVFFQSDRVEKRTNDVIVGVTQLLNPRTSLTANLSWGRQRGYLSDPYKLVEKTIEIVPGLSLPITFAENRPAERDKWIGFLSLNRAFPEARGAIDVSYRLYHDSYDTTSHTYDTTSHTLDLAWFQNLGERVILRPGLRFYDQSAADFYHYRLDGTSIVPLRGPPITEGPFYSSDYRLSEMQTFTYGVKLVWNATRALQFDVAVERYDMRGKDRVTPKSAYATADIITLGAKFSW
jgi:hypothetical protein